MLASPEASAPLQRFTAEECRAFDQDGLGPTGRIRRIGPSVSLVAVPEAIPVTIYADALSGAGWHAGVGHGATAGQGPQRRGAGRRRAAPRRRAAAAGRAGGGCPRGVGGGAPEGGGP